MEWAIRPGADPCVCGCSIWREGPATDPPRFGSGGQQASFIIHKCTVTPLGWGARAAGRQAASLALMCLGKGSLGERPASPPLFSARPPPTAPVAARASERTSTLHQRLAQTPSAMLTGNALRCCCLCAILQLSSIWTHCPQRRTAVPHCVYVNTPLWNTSKATPYKYYT